LARPQVNQRCPKRCIGYEVEFERSSNYKANCYAVSPRSVKKLFDYGVCPAVHPAKKIAIAFSLWRKVWYDLSVENLGVKIQMSRLKIFAWIYFFSHRVGRASTCVIGTRAVLIESSIQNLAGEKP
jgi:hypothetical protein